MCKHNLFTRTMLQPPLYKPYGNTTDTLYMMAVSMLSDMKARFWSQEKDEGCIPIQSHICNLFLDFAAQSTRIGCAFNQRNCNISIRNTPLFYSVAGKCGLIDFPCNTGCSCMCEWGFFIAVYREMYINFPFIQCD